MRFIGFIIMSHYYYVCLMATRWGVVRPFHTTSAFRQRKKTSSSSSSSSNIAVVNVLTGHRPFVLQAISSRDNNKQQRRQQRLPRLNMLHKTCPMDVVGTGPLYMAEQQEQQANDDIGEGPSASTFAATSATTTSFDLTDEEIQYLEQTFAGSLHDASALTKLVVETLPTMKPGLVIKLKQAQSDRHETVRAVATSMAAIMDAQLEEARDTLQSLLEAGEIRKLDSLIGKAARDGKLDAAFFTVLNMNLQDATREQADIEAQQKQEEKEGDKDASGANRVQILRHVHTRCQEEVEKNVPPGIALLNKLLRTDQASIRANQLKHYLCPQPNTITTPDGKQVELNGGEPRILVPPEQLVEAIGQAVKQIRTVEKAGGTSPAAAASMVESCRQVAKEARIVIGENYGIESEELKTFGEGLQPVFRPKTPDSPYIKGE